MRVKFVFFLYLVAGVLSQEQPPSTPSQSSTNPPATIPSTNPTTTIRTTISTPEPADTTTSDPSTTTPTTTAATTTSTSPKPTTSATTTTSPTPKPTTPATTTVKPTTSTPTTTVPPTTTTSKPTTTTLPPIVPDIPTFPGNNGSWAFPGSGNETVCIVVQGALQLHVQRQNKSELVVDVPSSSLPHVKIYGKCNSTEQQLTINWWSKTSTPDASERNNNLTLKFAKQTDGTYSLLLIKYQYTHKDHVIINGPFFPTDLKHSYLCHSNQRIQSENGSSYMISQDLHFEAFRDNRVGTDFSTPIECKADNKATTGVILGIAIGIGFLIVLVISIGIYLFKRFRRGGYQPLNTFQ